MSDEAALRDKAATLTRMLNLQGTIGMFGHVSVRIPGTDKCFISPGASTDKTVVRPDQMFVYNIDGTIIEHPGGLIPLEWRIHTQIHRDRPDAMCICHLHAPHARALGVAGTCISFLRNPCGDGAGGASLFGFISRENEPRLLSRFGRRQGTLARDPKLRRAASIPARRREIRR